MVLECSSVGMNRITKNKGVMDIKLEKGNRIDTKLTFMKHSYVNINVKS